ncbi:hypothetical protein BHE74_00008508, partial [Ensete ventricosum]
GVATGTPKERNRATGEAQSPVLHPHRFRLRLFASSRAELSVGFNGFGRCGGEEHGRVGGDDDREPRGGGEAREGGRQGSQPRNRQHLSRTAVAPLERLKILLQVFKILIVFSIMELSKASSIYGKVRVFEDYLEAMVLTVLGLSPIRRSSSLAMNKHQGKIPRLRAVLARAPSSPAGRQRAVATRGRFFSLVRRRSVIPFLLPLLRLIPSDSGQRRSKSIVIGQFQAIMGRKQPQSVVQSSSGQSSYRFVPPGSGGTHRYSEDAQLTPLLRLGAGACAGIIAMSATYPMDMVRGRITVQVLFLVFAYCIFSVMINSSSPCQRFINLFLLCRMRSRLTSTEACFMHWALSTVKKAFVLCTKAGYHLS